MNIINGGAHADNALDPQEFMIVPHGAPTFAEALRMGVEVFHTLKGLLKKKGLATSVGDEGGFAPDLRSNEEALETILEAIKGAGYKAGTQISLALDVAASELHEGKKYVFKKSGGAVKTSEQMVAMYEKWVKDYPIVSLEDGLGEKDWPGWKALTDALGGKVQLVGDELFVTNPEDPTPGIEEGVANSLPLKGEPSGTLPEALVRLALAGRALKAAAPSGGGGMDADPERTPPLEERDGTDASGGRMAPGTVHFRVRGLDPLSLPLAHPAAPRHELTASVGNHSCPS